MTVQHLKALRNQQEKGTLTGRLLMVSFLEPLSVNGERLSNSGFNTWGMTCMVELTTLASLSFFGISLTKLPAYAAKKWNSHCRSLVVCIAAPIYYEKVPKLCRDCFHFSTHWRDSWLTLRCKTYKKQIYLSGQVLGTSLWIQKQC